MVFFFKLPTDRVSAISFRHELYWFSAENHRSKTKLLPARKQRVHPTFSDSLPSNGLAAEYQFCKVCVSLNAPGPCYFAALIGLQWSRKQTVVRSVQAQLKLRFTI